MAKRILAAFRLEAELIDGLKAVQARDGVPQSEQVRRALAAYLREKGVLKKNRAAKVRSNRV